MLCQYADSLGVPGKGVHARRVAGLAVNDFVGTAAAAVVAAGLITAGREQKNVRTFVVFFVWSFLLLLLLAFGAHEAFCVNTRLNAAVFGRPWPS